MKPQPPPDLWEKLENAWQAIAKQLPSRPGPEWFSIAEYSQKCGTKTSGAADRLRKLVMAGVVERSEKSGGRVWYRLIT